VLPKGLMSMPLGEGYFIIGEKELRRFGSGGFLLSKVKDGKIKFIHGVLTSNIAVPTVDIIGFDVEKKEIVISSLKQSDLTLVNGFLLYMSFPDFDDTPVNARISKKGTTYSFCAH